jgi:enamine deaminase RidA (YjgF/YER057c/UK114 family)
LEAFLDRTYLSFTLKHEIVMPFASNQPLAFNPLDVPAPPSSYKHVAVTPLLPSTKLITLAGMTGCDPVRTDNPKTVSEQAPIAYDNIKKALAAAGATPRDIVQVRHYIVKETGVLEVDKTDVVDRGWAELWTEFMDREADGHRPPDTVVGVASLAKSDILYECEVWAVVH